MKRRTRTVVHFMAAIAFAIAAVSCSNTFEAELETDRPAHVPRKVTFFHTTDTHSKYFPFIGDPSANGTDKRMDLLKPETNPYGGVSRLTQLLKWQRDISGLNFYIDSGDIFQGAPIFNLMRGQVEILGIHHSGVDVMVIGNHEFDNGTNALVSQLEKVAGRPHFVLANYVFEDPSLEGNKKLASMTRPYVILERDGFRMAVIGMGDYGSITSLPIFGNSLGIMGANAIEVLSELVLRIRPMVDLVVVASHMGLDDDRATFRQIKGVGLVFGGHNHTITSPPIEVMNPEGKRVLIVHSGVDMKYLTRFDAMVMDGEVIDYNHNIFPIDTRCRKCTIEVGGQSVDIENSCPTWPDDTGYRPCATNGVWDILADDNPQKPGVGSTVWMYGVKQVSSRFTVSSTGNLDGMFVSDAQTGAFHGMQVVFDAGISIEGGAPGRGAVLEINGSVDEYSGLTQIRATSIKVLSEAVEGEEPKAVIIDDPSKIANNGILSEAYKGVLVEVHDVEVTNGDLGYNEIELKAINRADDSVTGLRMDDAMYRYPLGDLTNGTKLKVLRGILSYSFENFKVLPRDADDLVFEDEEDTAPAGIALADLPLDNSGGGIEGVCSEYCLPNDPGVDNMLRPFDQALSIAQDMNRSIGSSSTGFLRKETAIQNCSDDESCCNNQVCTDGICEDVDPEAAANGGQELGLACTSEADCRGDETCRHDDSGAGTCARINRGDSALGNLLTDAMRLYPRLSADFSITNSLGIRTDFPPGDLTMGKMYEVFPFENSLALVYLSGLEVQELFDFVARKSGARGCSNQVQVSGIDLVIDCGKRKVKEVVIGDTVVVDNYRLVAPFATFVVATNDYMAGGGSGFNTFRYNTTQFDTKISLRDILNDFMAKNKIDKCTVDYRAKMLP